MLHKICIVLLLGLSIDIQADVFTALAEFENLFTSHQLVQEKLHNYIKSEEKRLTILKRYLKIYTREHEKAMRDIPEYLGNPINAFTLLKRLKTDLDYIKLNINTRTEFELGNSTHYNAMNVNYPTEEDLKGAAEALNLIQETYRLDVKELVEGRLYGIEISTPLSASDCYELGHLLHKTKYFENSLTFMFAAHRKYKEENNSYPFSYIDIVDFICSRYYELGNNRNLKIKMYLNSNDTEASQIIEICERRFANNNVYTKLTKQTPVSLDENILLRVPMLKSDYPFCRGDIEISTEISRRLTCYYWSETHPFLKIAPLKAEMMFINPDIVLFHDVLYEDEIELLKKTSMPLLARAVVRNPKTNGPSTSNSRVSKSAWLNDTESTTAARISRRVSQMTGLSMESAEDLQVANYGICGHYTSHYDFSQEHQSMNWTGGNRIATVLFYMSDVALGGATIFSKLGLSVRPRKGAALFWYNLHPSGKGDLATIHTACPVLYGNKWVCSKWLHEYGQEFRRPCTLEYQPEGIRHKIPTFTRRRSFDMVLT